MALNSLVNTKITSPFGVIDVNKQNLSVDKIIGSWKGLDPKFNNHELTATFDSLGNFELKDYSSSTKKTTILLGDTNIKDSIGKVNNISFKYQYEEYKKINNLRISTFLNGIEQFKKLDGTAEFVGKDELKLKLNFYESGNKFIKLRRF